MADDNDIWEPDMQAFERADEKQPPPRGQIVFVGSSTFTFWLDVARDLPDFHIINRGFGGSELPDSIRYAHRIVIPYAPRQVVLYAGDNDIGGGKPGALVARDFRIFADLIHASLPETLVTYLSIKPSIDRWHLVDEIRDANRRIEDYCKTAPQTSYIDAFQPTLNEVGELRPELYIEDGLHLNRKGYRLWASIMIPHLLPDPALKCQATV